MGRVLTNQISLQVAEELTIGVLPGSPVWNLLEPNGINTMGADISTVERSPISKNRQRQKGTITDLDSAIEYESDFTLSQFEIFIEGFMFSQFIGALTFPGVTAVDTGGSAGFVVPAAGDLLVRSLVYARAFNLEANNGLHEVAASSTTVLIRVDGLEEEVTVPVKSMVEVAGYRGDTGDFEIDANGDMISTTLDFTTLDIQVGQMMWVGGEEALNTFAVAANRGFCRVITVATNKLTLDKTSLPFTIDNGSAKEIDIYFGQFVRNVAVDHATDFVEKYFQFEAAYPNLESPGPGDEYEYSKGNLCNTMGFELPLTNKAGATFGFIGTDTPAPTGSRATNAATPLDPVKTSAMNTTSDIARLRILQVDETGLTTDFKSASITINNNVSPEKVLAQLGAKYMNAGNFEVDIESQLIFTNGAVVAAIRANTTLTMDFALRNDDGAIVVDMPSLTIGGGGKDFPVNESVLLNTTCQAFQDDVLGYSLSVSLFPFAPAS